MGLLWSYWPALLAVEGRWAHDPQYSHGFLVPFFALLVLWRKRTSFPTELHPEWLGAAGLAAAAFLRLLGGYFYFEWIEGLSFLLSLWSAAVLIGGRRLGLCLIPAFAVLLFLFPPPFQAETALAGPLQQLATAVGTYALQTLGFAAVAEGNVIVVGDYRIGVLEACSGLGMLSAFFALSTTAALIVNRPIAERVVLFLSAAPIGVLMNLIRITATAYVYATLGATAAHAFFHDLAGWLMMPAAFAALWLEMALLGRLFVAAPPTGVRRGVSPPCIGKQGGLTPRRSPTPLIDAPQSALTV
ncbi:MAG TPA: exosortase/archaeosortase family protein [Gemmataceae bacterium]|nr:exosortase/archaeosortase family protein [Gemmataceae bacterium]